MNERWTHPTFLITFFCFVKRKLPPLLKLIVSHSLVCFENSQRFHKRAKNSDSETIDNCPCPREPRKLNTRIEVCVKYQPLGFISLQLQIEVSDTTGLYFFAPIPALRIDPAPFPVSKSQACLLCAYSLLQTNIPDRILPFNRYHVCSAPRHMSGAFLNDISNECQGLLVNVKKLCSPFITEEGLLQGAKQTAKATYQIVQITQSHSIANQGGNPGIKQLLLEYSHQLRGKHTLPSWTWFTSFNIHLECVAVRS